MVYYDITFFLKEVETQVGSLLTASDDVMPPAKVPKLEGELYGNLRCDWSLVTSFCHL